MPTNQPTRCPLCGGCLRNHDQADVACRNCGLNRLGWSRIVQLVAIRDAVRELGHARMAYENFGTDVHHVYQREVGKVERIAEELAREELEREKKANGTVQDP